MDRMSERFKIVDGQDYCYLNDTKGELASLPLMFKYDDLNENNKKKLHKWIKFLNNKSKPKARSKKQ